MNNKMMAWRRLTGSSKTFLINVLSSFGVKGLSILVGFVSMPAFISYFGDNAILGLWFTMLSVLSWILMADMGIGNGLRNKIIPSLEEGNPVEVRKYVSSSYLSLLAVSAVICAVLLCAIPFVDWGSLFGLELGSADLSDLDKAVAIIVVAICLQFVLRLVASITYAMQRAFIPSLLTLITNLSLLLCCLAAIAFNVSGSIVLMAIFYLLSANVPLIVATFVVFMGRLRGCFPSPKYFSVQYAKDVVSLGVAFLWLQFMALLLNNTPSFLIALFSNSSDVVEYQLYLKVFTLGSSMVLLAAAPIWSAATKAKYENNFKWLQKLFYLFFVGLAGIVMLQLLLALFIQPIFDLWLGVGYMEAQSINVVVLAIYGAILAWSAVVTQFGNGLGELKLQTIFLTIGACSNIPLAYFLTGLLGSYLGVVVSNMLAYIPYLLVQTIWLIFYLNKRVTS